MKTTLLLLVAAICAMLWVQPAMAQSLKMNEIYSRGVTTDPDWIEIHNGTAAPITLTGYKIYDIGGQSGTKPKKRFPDGTTIPVNGFFVIVTDTPDSSGFGLSSTGETVWLENPSGAIIDSITFPSMATTQSYSRIPNGGTWQLTSTITRGTSNIATAVEERGSLPGAFALLQNYPNPFNPATTIEFSVPAAGFVRLQVFDLLGREVATLAQEVLPAGSYRVRFDAAGLSGGVYFYTLTAGTLRQTRSLTLLK